MWSFWRGDRWSLAPLMQHPEPHWNVYNHHNTHIWNAKYIYTVVLLLFTIYNIFIKFQGSLLFTSNANQYKQKTVLAEPLSSYMYWHIEGILKLIFWNSMKIWCSQILMKSQYKINKCILVHKFYFPWFPSLLIDIQ